MRATSLLPRVGNGALSQIMVLILLNKKTTDTPPYENIISDTLVISHYNIFLPLLLTLLSDNLVLLPPSPIVTICLPYRIDYRLSKGCHVANAHAYYISRVHF